MINQPSSINFELLQHEREKSNQFSIAYFYLRMKIEIWILGKERSGLCKDESEMHSRLQESIKQLAAAARLGGSEPENERERERERKQMIAKVSEECNLCGRKIEIGRLTHRSLTPTPILIPRPCSSASRIFERMDGYLYFLSFSGFCSYLLLYFSPFPLSFTFLI